MRRYKFLTKDFVFNALNKLRAAFLAAKDGEEVEAIMKAILTHDERMKIGRRIEIAQLVLAGMTYHEITTELKVGMPTVVAVAKKIEQYPQAFKLINQREEKVEITYQQKAYRKVGGPQLVFKKKEFTGFTRKQVQR